MNRIHVLSNQFDGGLISAQEATSQALTELARLLDGALATERNCAVVSEQVDYLKARVHKLEVAALEAAQQPAPVNPQALLDSWAVGDHQPIGHAENPAPTGPLDAPAYPDRMSDVLLDAATGQECKAIPVKDYDAALSMLRLLRRMIDDPAYQISDLQRKVNEIIDTIERGEAI